MCMLRAKRGSRHDGPDAVLVWYSYQPGGLLTVLSGRRSRKARSRGPTAGIGPGILITRGEPSPRQIILPVRPEREAPADLNVARSAGLNASLRRVASYAA